VSAHPGEQGESQRVDQIQRRQRPTVTFESGVGDARTGAGGGCVVEHRVALGLRCRGGLLGDDVAVIHVTQFDAVSVELVVAEFDRLAQRSATLVAGHPGLVEHVERLPAVLGGLIGFQPERRLYR